MLRSQAVAHALFPFLRKRANPLEDVSGMRLSSLGDAKLETTRDQAMRAERPVANQQFPVTRVEHLLNISGTFSLKEQEIMGILVRPHKVDAS
ncbi:hypothetical protein NDU88_005932 [Pleurodeles waltl]|uniref:Uncharacterized protein n=1 Tax=Pleurodeles waltl TaxID=8319 RepID=A0AAV7UKE7_PLEWA|nr:hypothetical protein NDU88_005932 [Pleurodeles waltl]